MINAHCTSDTWHGCYDDGWKGLIVDDAFAHPAKMSYSLAARIYEHAFKSGWLKPGDTVVDPFGGIAGTALHAAIQGVRWLGCELEPKFHGLANANIDLWQSSYGHYPEWVRPTIHCGDSRRLCEVLGVGADVCVSSPPYSESLSGNQASEKDTHESMRRRGWSEKSIAKATSHTGGLGYGSTPGQLGSVGEETFWSAAREIVEQCHTILRPGGHAIWVCKDFVRKGKRVPFSDQWLALCEACGFTLVCRHRASLVKQGGVQKLLEGGEERRVK